MNSESHPKTTKLQGHIPTVSILVLNLNGLHHLEACLPSLEAQTYPRDRVEIVVVDNGSIDGSLAFVRAHHPRVRIVAYASNRGFASAYNSAVDLCQTDFVAFLNNDTRVDVDWLAELVGAATRHAAVSVASRILDWTGERIDFAGGVVSFIGHAWQRDAGQSATGQYAEERLLFACGGSMLVRRQVFLDAGGFDPDFFAYFEDVDLGWRLSLLGHTTVLAPSAVTYHRIHGTASRWSLPPRLRLYERNALMMIYKNYEDETLARVLPVAIALAVARACAHTSFDPRTFEFGRPIPDRLPLSTRTVGHLIGLEDFATKLPALSEKRTAIQRTRRRSDADLLPLFRDPLRLHELGPGYEQTARALIAEFEIDRWLDPSTPAHGQAMSTQPLVAPTASTAPTAPLAPPAPLTLTSLTAAAPEVATDAPMVSIVILVAAGPTHLPECLDSLRTQTYPADRREVIVVDNGSADDPTAVVRRHDPGARVIRNGSNLGFAAGNNVGLRAATGKYVAFLNDDTRVDPNWLTELVGLALRRRAACVASRLLSWDGRRIDFTSGTMNVEGKGFHRDHARRVGDDDTETPAFFPNGAAMLVDRSVLLDMGGWDEGAFAYYEDVELGWRFWLLGEEVWTAPKAIVFHKHHGTSGRWAEASRVRLYERNSLRMLYTHLERHHLERVLPAALLLAADRVLLQTGLGRSNVHADVSARPPGRLTRLWRAGSGARWHAKRALLARGAGRHMSPMANLRHLGASGLLSTVNDVVRDTLRHARSAASHPRSSYLMESGSPGPLDGRDESTRAAAGAALTGLQEFLSSLPELSRRRAWLQSRRRRSDSAILAPFNESWLSPTPAADPIEHGELQRLLTDTFRLAEIAGVTAPPGHRPRSRDQQHDARSPVSPPVDPEPQPEHAEPDEMRKGRAGRLLDTPWIRLIKRGYERASLHSVPLRGFQTIRPAATSGQSAEPVRSLGPLRIGDVDHEALSCDPPSNVECRVTGWSGGRVVVWCSLMPEAWAKNSGGVNFRLAVRTEAGTAETAVHLRPSRFQRIPRWHRLQVPLPASEGDLHVTLHTQAPSGEETAYALAVWGDPHLECARPLLEIWRAFRGAVGLLGFAGTVRRLTQLGTLTDDSATYERWLAENTPTTDDLRAMHEEVATWTFRPRISIVTPVYNTDPRWLRAAIDSVHRQVYPDWQLCLCDDKSTSEETLAVLRKAAADPRVLVTYLGSNQGISGASNGALSTASGEFVAMLDHDDEIAPDALYQVVKFLNEHPDADMIYSDEDKLDRLGRRCDPYFKPDWSPEHFFTCMYTSHLMVVRRSVMRAAGGFRTGYEGAQDFDLVLRVIRSTSRIHHIPRILYHWRKTEGSAAGSGMAKPWALAAGRTAIADHVAHTRMDAEVEMGATPGQYRVRHVVQGQPRVSIVMAGAGARRPITSADAAAVLRCVRGMEGSDYDDYEVIVVEDGSMSDAERAAVRTRRSRSVTCTDAGGADLAARVNFGVSQSGGAHVVVCCDLVEPRNADWLQSMLEYSQQTAIGVVGAKQLYPDGRLRHVGVVLGLGGIAGLPFHGFPGSFPGYISSAIGVRNYSAVSGACMMTRRAVFDEVGGFRGAFGAQFADIDYCLRVRRSGYRVVFTPYAEIRYLGPDLGASIHGDAEEEQEMRRVWADTLTSDPYYNRQLTTEFFDARPRVDTLA